MNLWPKAKRATAGHAVRAASAFASARVAAVFDEAHQCDVDTLLAYLNALIAKRGADLLQTGVTTGGDLQAPPSGFGVFMIELRRSDRTRALAGVEGARDVLATLCRRAAELLRSGDRFALIGVEGLLLVLPEVDSAGRALLVAARLVQILQEPMREGGLRGYVHARVRPAIGCALFPAHGVDAESLIAAADRACHAACAIEEGYRIAESGAEVHDDANLSSDLEAALQANQLEVWLQPQYNLRTQRFDAAEALIRWSRSEGVAPVEPIKVIELAEAQGLMPTLTLFVLNTVLRQSAAFSQRGIDLRIAVNLSASMLTDVNLPRTVQQALELWGVAPDRLTLEVTENTLMQDIEGSLATLHALKRVGTRLSLDDFGTGYSSFAYLRRMPLDELKIDQLFVRNLGAAHHDGSDPRTSDGKHDSDMRIVRSIVDIAHNFDLQTVAEGVEDEVTLELLGALGCDVIQGYFTARPMPIGAFEAWWREHATGSGYLMPSSVTM
ncbi:MAG: putative bifunctional diguanylate cyclase/phosphodiesterase [Burkholderiaceae bacterium]